MIEIIELMYGGEKIMGTNNSRRLQDDAETQDVLEVGCLFVHIKTIAANTIACLLLLSRTFISC